MSDFVAPNNSSDFERRVADILRANQIRFERDVVIAGLQTDFLVETPAGRSIVIEAKRWPITDINLNRAIHQVRLYQQTAGVDRAILVLQNLPHSRPTEGIVTEKELIDVLREEIEDKDIHSSHLFFGRGKRLEEYFKRRVNSPQKTIFAAMPFSPEYDDVYFVAMAYAAHSINAVCRRVDREDFEGDVVKEIKNLIHESVAVIADLSESKPNVLYETGFAHALNRPTVHICSSPLALLPFDVRNWNTIEYSRGQTFAIRDTLAKRLAGIA